MGEHWRVPGSIDIKGEKSLLKTSTRAKVVFKYRKVCLRCEMFIRHNNGRG